MANEIQIVLPLYLSSLSLSLSLFLHLLHGIKATIFLEYLNLCLVDHCTTAYIIGTGLPEFLKWHPVIVMQVDALVDTAFTPTSDVLLLIIAQSLLPSCLFSSPTPHPIVVHLSVIHLFTTILIVEPLLTYPSLSPSSWHCSSLIELPSSSSSNTQLSTSW